MSSPALRLTIGDRTFPPNSAKWVTPASVMAIADSRQRTRPATCCTNCAEMVSGVGNGRCSYIGKQRHQRRVDCGCRQRACDVICGRLHQRAVEGGGYAQQYAPLNAMVLCQRNRAVNRTLMSGNNDLRWVVVIGDGTGFALRGGCSQAFCLFYVRAKQSGHGANADRHSRLHCATTQFKQRRRHGQRQRPCGT